MSKINKIKIKDVSYDIEDLSIGDLNELETTDKSNLVNAINEVMSIAGGSSINGFYEVKYDMSFVNKDKPIGLYINTSSSRKIITMSSAGLNTTYPLNRGDILLYGISSDNIQTFTYINAISKQIMIIHRGVNGYNSVAFNSDNFATKSYVDTAINNLKAELGG